MVKEKPKMELAWLRGLKHIDFTQPTVFFTLGKRGGGKSAFLETVASKYLDNGAKVIDLFGSRDGEGLGWLRSPYVYDREIALFHGDYVKVNGWNNTIPATKFKLEDLDKADIFISASPFYYNIDDEFNCVNRIVDVLWRRTSWDKPICIIVREASNLLYSRIKISHSQTIAKGDMIYLLRESRHCGLALALDSLRFTSIDIDIRALTDFLVIKNTGMHGLPDDLWWVYRIFDPSKLRRLNPSEFAVVSHEGYLGVGHFDLPGWHKETSENLLYKLNLSQTYLERPEPKEPRRRWK